MNSDSELDIKLDADGKVDVKYYIDLGHTLRAQHMAKGLKKVSLFAMARQIQGWIKALLASYEQNLLALRVYDQTR